MSVYKYIHISLHIFSIIYAIVHPGGNGDIFVKIIRQGVTPQKQQTHVIWNKWSWLCQVMPALFMTHAIGGDPHAIMAAWRFQDHHSISLSRDGSLIKALLNHSFFAGYFQQGFGSKCHDSFRQNSRTRGLLRQLFAVRKGTCGSAWSYVSRDRSLYVSD